MNTCTAKKFKITRKGIIRKIIPEKIYISVRQLRLSKAFANYVVAAHEQQADVIFCRDTLSSSAGLALAQHCPNAVNVIDITEIPELAQRANERIRNISKYARNKLEEWGFAYIKKASFVYTLNNALKNFIDKHYNLNCKVWHNTNNLTAQPNDYFRKMFKLAEDDIIISFNCTISPEAGVLEAISAIEFLPKNIHLVFFGPPSSTTFKQIMLKHIKKLRLDQNIHFHEPDFDEKKYLQMIASSDIGLILFDTEYLQTKLTLPNRFFDYIAAQIPILSTDMDDVKAYILSNDIGEVVENSQPEVIAQGIKNIILRYGISKNKIINNDVAKRLKNMANEFSKQNCFEKMAKELRLHVKDIEKPELSFLVRTRLDRNTRVVRQCKALVAAGFKVTLYCVNELPAPILLSQIPDVKINSFKYN